MIESGLSIVEGNSRSISYLLSRDALGLENGAGHPNPVYSICITYRNMIGTVARSLTSILSQLDDRFEVVIVDGGSTDGTVEAVRRIQGKYGRLTLICHPCSRGQGRDIAYRLSKGKYVIQGGDGDMIYRPTLQSILDYYHSCEKVFEKYALVIPGAFLCICTRDIMDSVGGWPDLQYAEDVYIYVKLMQVCTVERNTSLFDVAVKEHVRSKRRFLSYADLEYTYIVWRDFHRYLPIAQMIEILRRYLRRKRVLPIKFGTAALFLLGALGQYSKTRYKLHGEELQSFLQAERLGMIDDPSYERSSIL